MRPVPLALVSAIVAIVLLLAASEAGGAQGALPAASGRGEAARVIPKVLPCLGSPEARPANYLLSCADANASWKKVKWLTWGAKTALGTGDLYQNDCRPNCVSGQFRSYRSRVVLSEVRRTKKYGLLFSEATFSYSSKGKHISETFGLAT